MIFLIIGIGCGLIQNLLFAYLFWKLKQQKQLLRKSYYALEPLAGNFGHWYAGIKGDELHKPCTFSIITWQHAWDAHIVYCQIENDVIKPRTRRIFCGCKEIK